MIKTVSKSVLLTIAVSCITAGIKLIETDLYAGIALLAVGLALVITFGLLIEKQAKQAGERAAKLVLEKMKHERKTDR